MVASMFLVSVGRQRIAKTCLDNGTMNGHSILGWILQFPDGRGRYFYQCLSTNLRSIPYLTRTTNQERPSIRNKITIIMHSLVHLLDKGGTILSSSWPGSSFEDVAN